MSKDIPSEVSERQTAAADPQVSAWVAANAGSGKTHVLAQRVINLLLEGAEPEKILCITFTRAAAANMAKRVFDTLGRWTSLDDASLDEAISMRSSGGSNPRRRAVARRLFARALETPGGLKVQTIHAFCTRLLQQFPFEAEVAARFDVLDDTEQRQLLERLTLDVLLAGAGDPASKLGRALATAMSSAADVTFRDLVREAIGKRDAIGPWLQSADDLDAFTAMSTALGVEPSLTLAEVEADIVDGPVFPSSEWASAAALCRTGSTRDQEQCDRLTLAQITDGAERVRNYFKVFIDNSGAPRANILTRDLVKKYPELAGRLQREQARVVALRERRNGVICRDRSAALLTVTAEVLRRYRREKLRRGLLDYDDLIDKTLALLTNVDAAWVHYKLDLGIDHVLIDEAQDTSSKQWQIVRLLTDEFTAGAGARAVRRTIFAVGDEKQSIYSFQYAAPKEFAEMRRHFEVAHQNSGLKFVPTKFEHSFRSGASVLTAVDTVFKGIATSVTSDANGFPPHIALPKAAPSLVEIWEPVKPEAKREPIEGWDAPFDTASETSPRVQLARKIAHKVRGLVDDGTARCGDILVLVRQRGALFEAIIRALKNENVEVAGADRLILTEHIAVMDLMVLADALLLPQDDLALATVLRSPLFGFEDNALFAIASGRGRLSLRAALARHVGEQFAVAATRLDELTLAARQQTPFAFFAGILSGGARRRFLMRLGPEANDALDEFLNLALEYERRETPSLQGFLAWLQQARAEVKRDMEIARDEVRVMTVHGAKGLEAPIVILADTMTPPAGPRPPRLLSLAGSAPVWAGRKADDAGAMAAARQVALREAEDEYRRLLYVAMTRAADRLIICGAEGQRRRPQGCWYDLVRDPLNHLLTEADDNGEKVLRYCAETPAPALPVGEIVPAKPTPQPLPDWLRQPVALEVPPPAAISPSSAFEDAIGHSAGEATQSATERQKALARGRLLHRLMQSLPDIPPERRKYAAERYLAKAAIGFDPAERTEIAGHVLAVLDDPRYAAMFAPGSRAEVPIVGRIHPPTGEPILVAGQVDRLSVTDEAVLIADYKSDRRVPRGLDEVAPYVAQLALYRAVLARTFPGKTVRAALVFTEGPSLIEAPGPVMDAALADVIQSHAAVKVP